MLYVGKYRPYMDPMAMGYTDLDISKQKTCISEFPPNKKQQNFQLKIVFFFEKTPRKATFTWVKSEYFTTLCLGGWTFPTRVPGGGDDRVSPQKQVGITGDDKAQTFFPKMN